MGSSLSNIVGLFGAGELWWAEKSSGEEHRTTHQSDHKNSIPFGIEEIDSALRAGGLQRGAVHEVIYDHEIGAPPFAVLAHLTHNALTPYAPPPASKRKEFKKVAVWITDRDHISPHTFKSDFLPGVFFLSPPNRKLAWWSIAAALSSPAVAIVVAEIDEIPFALSRKFALCAKSGGGIVCLFKQRREAHKVSAAATRWEVRPTASPGNAVRFILSLIAAKGTLPAEREWLIESPLAASAHGEPLIRSVKTEAEQQELSIIAQQQHGS